MPASAIVPFVARATGTQARSPPCPLTGLSQLAGNATVIAPGASVGKMQHLGSRRLPPGANRVSFVAAIVYRQD
jgi:hypothetical protein